MPNKVRKTKEGTDSRDSGFCIGCLVGMPNELLIEDACELKIR